MKHKKLLLVTLCIMLLIAFGCKKQENAVQKTTESDSTASTTASTKTEEPTTKEQIAITKPSKITVMWDGSLVSEDNGGKEFAKTLSEKLGITVELLRPVHVAYYDVLQTAFVSDEVPDVFVLGPDYYVTYAKQGVLWNMTDAWNNSDLKASGRLDTWAINIIEGLETEGKRDEKGIYGFPLERGSGYVTYVRTAWLEACGYSADGKEIKTYDDYYNMCLAFKNKYNVAPIIGTRFFAYTESSGYERLYGTPYTQYYQEIYQSACGDFYKNANDVWVDGFLQPEMLDALERFTQFRDAKLFHMDNSTMLVHEAVEIFCKEQAGVLTYFNDKGADELIAGLKTNGATDTRVTALKPIAELGKYMELQPPVVAIYEKAENQAGIFKYFIEPIYDGGEVQSLWTYGVKGIHWDNKAQNVTVNGVEYAYAEGEFHFLPDVTKTKFNEECCIDVTRSLGKFSEGKDPGVNLVSEETKKVMEMFNDSSKMCKVGVGDTVTGLREIMLDINKARSTVLINVVVNNYTPAEAIEIYKNSVGNKVQMVLNELNR